MSEPWVTLPVAVSDSAGCALPVEVHAQIMMIDYIPWVVHVVVSLRYPTSHLSISGLWWHNFLLYPPTFSVFSHFSVEIFLVCSWRCFVLSLMVKIIFIFF